MERDGRIGLTDVIRTVDKVRSLRKAKYSNYSLTELGREKSEEYGGQGKDFEILNYLSENGPSTTKSIAEGVNLPEGKAKVALDRLMKSQYIMRVPQNG